MLKFILFDLDGTLTDPKEGITKSVSYALKRFGIERDPDSLTEFIGPPLKEQFMKYASLSEKDGERAVNIYRERFAPIGIFENKLYDGIIEMLAELKNCGYTLAVATSKPYVFAEKIVEKFGMKSYFEIVEGSELDGRNTNKADVIRNAMKKLGAGSSDTIMVGDREHDCIGARKNGLRCIGVTYGYAKCGELENSGACALASSPQGICEILKTI